MIKFKEAAFWRVIQKEKKKKSSAKEHIGRYD